MCSLALDYLPEMTPLNGYFAGQDVKISPGADTRVHRDAKQIRFVSLPYSWHAR